MRAMIPISFYRVSLQEHWLNQRAERLWQHTALAISNESNIHYALFGILIQDVMQNINVAAWTQFNATLM